MTELERILSKTERKNELYKKLPKVLLPWYEKNARDLPWRKTKEPYAVWLSEIMLQQTRVEAVKGYYHRFLKELPTIQALAEAREETLLKLWEGLGYYNRVRNIQKAAKLIVCENNGVFPSEYSEILALPGIGEYTAGAIASVCFNEPVAAVDGNVLRIFSRITEDNADVRKESTKKKVKGKLEAIYPKDDCGEFTQSLMELGATICIPSGVPKCEICPAYAFCLAGRHGTWTELPKKKKKKERKIEEKTVFVLREGGTIAVRKRKHTGLLAGLWELPNVDGKLSPGEAIKRAEVWGCKPTDIEKRIVRSHIFTHIEWHMTCYFLRCQEKNGEFTWVTDKERKEKIALPTAFRLFLEEELREAWQ